MFHVKHSISFDGLVREPAAREQFSELLNLLVKRNAQMNLTAIREPEQIRQKHFADSLAIGLWDGFKGTERVLDLGTGGGFPGLPIKIMYPGADVTMLDSKKKKLGFIDEVIDELELGGACTLWARAEDAAHVAAYRGQYDLVVSRAVAYLPSLIECAVPFLKKGGVFAAYKQGDHDDEIEASGKILTLTGARITQEIVYEIDGVDDTRRLLLIEKTADTPKRYPRKAGKPVKDPII